MNETTSISEKFTSVKEKCLKRMHEVGAGHGVTMASRILACLFNQFVRHVLIEDIEDYLSLEGRPFIYLANHQTGIESLLFNGISVEKTQFKMAVAKSELSESVDDVGVLARLYYSHGEAERRSSGLFFVERESPLKMLASLKGLMERIFNENIACLIHIEGTRSQCCLDRVKNLNSVIIDEAVRLGIPLVPLRMTGGLPFNGNSKLDFPANAGKQDYWIGKSIRPDDIKNMNLKERKEYILGRINGLGEESGPIITGSLFTNLIKHYREKYGFSNYMSPVYMAIESGKKDSLLNDLAEYISGRIDAFPHFPDNRTWYQKLRESFFPRTVYEHGT